MQVFEPLLFIEPETEGARRLAWRCRSCLKVALFDEPVLEPTECASCGSTAAPTEPPLEQSTTRHRWR